MEEIRKSHVASWSSRRRWCRRARQSILLAHLATHPESQLRPDGRRPRADGLRASSWASAPHRLERPIAERPAVEIGLDTAPDLREPLRLEQKEQDDAGADGAHLHAEQHRSEAPGAREITE